MSLLVLLVALLIATLGYMTAWFVVARVSDRTDVIDSAWALGFVYIAWLAFAIDAHHTPLKIWAGIFVTLWGLRLFLHLSNRNAHKSEDHRYVVYRQKWGDNYWPLAYLRIFLVQGVLLWLISFATVAIMAAQNQAWQWLAVIGFVVWAVAIGFEALSDWQLQQFITSKKHGKKIMTSGLWRFSRHPNYFGEVCAWWGAAIVAVSLGQWWGILGAVTITVLILKVSGIPLLEEHYKDNKAYQKYKRQTSEFVPLPPKKA